MPGISLKGQQMPESPIRKLVPYAEAAIKAGKTVYHLNIGQPDIATPEVVTDAVRAYDGRIIEYSHSAGYETYRRSLAEYYQKVGISVSYDEIIITAGGSEALMFGFNTCFDPEDEVIVPEPFYANYNGFSVASSIKLVPIESSIETGFALPPIADFEKAITPKTKGILICNPGNPTGYLYTQEELETLRDIVKKHDLFLFADEVYREFTYDGRSHHSVMNLKGIEQQVVMVDSVSKRYSMCGARIGCIVSHNKEVMATAMKFAQARLSPPGLGQIAAMAALNTPQSYFDEVIGEYNNRRNVLVEGLNNIDGVRCPKPKGAFYCIAELPVDSAERFCQWLLESFEHDGATVMMAPAAGFYSTVGSGTREVRIAYVLNEESLRKSLEILEAALAIYPGHIRHSNPMATQLI